MQIATKPHSTRLSRAATPVAAPDLARHIAAAWLVLGCVAVLTVPALRGTSTWFGWLPFWLVLMPAAECLLLRWRPLLAASRKRLARVRAHHRGRATNSMRRNRRSIAQQRSIWAVAFLR